MTVRNPKMLHNEACHKVGQSWATTRVMVTALSRGHEMGCELGCMPHHGACHEAGQQTTSQRGGTEKNFVWQTSLVPHGISGKRAEIEVPDYVQNVQQRKTMNKKQSIYANTKFKRQLVSKQNKTTGTE